MEGFGSRKKIIGNFQEASGGILGRDFTPPGGARRPLWAPFWGSQGSCWLSFWCLVLKMRKSQNWETVHTKTLIFKVPEASRGSFLEPKTVRKTTWKRRARRSTSGASKNRFPERSWRGSGAQEKTSVTSKSAQEEFPGHFSPQKCKIGPLNFTPRGCNFILCRLSPPGSSRGRPGRHF